eukprot:761633_1
MATTENELKELQAVWDKAVQSASTNHAASPSAIHAFNLKDLTEWSKSIHVSSKLRSIFEQLLQTYLNKNAKKLFESQRARFIGYCDHNLFEHRAILVLERG